MRLFFEMAGKRREEKKGPKDYARRPIRRGSTRRSG